MPQWLISLVSAVTGAIVSVFVQFLVLRMGDRYKQHKMRMVLYNELCWAARMLEVQLDVAKKDIGAKAVIYFSEESLLRPLIGPKYIADNYDIFVQLEENITITSLYSALESALKDRKSNHSAVFFIESLNDFAQRGVLKKKHMSKWRVEISPFPPKLSSGPRMFC